MKCLAHVLFVSICCMIRLLLDTNICWLTKGMGLLLFLTTALSKTSCRCSRNEPFVSDCLRAIHILYDNNEALVDLQSTKQITCNQGIILGAEKYKEMDGHFKQYDRVPQLRYRERCQGLSEWIQTYGFQKPVEATTNSYDNPLLPPSACRSISAASLHAGLASSWRFMSTCNQV